MFFHKFQQVLYLFKVISLVACIHFGKCKVASIGHQPHEMGAFVPDKVILDFEGKGEHFRQVRAVKLDHFIRFIMGSSFALVDDFCQQGDKLLELQLNGILFGIRPLPFIERPSCEPSNRSSDSAAEDSQERFPKLVAHRFLILAIAYSLVFMATFYMGYQSANSCHSQPMRMRDLPASIFRSLRRKYSKRNKKSAKSDQSD